VIGCCDSRVDPTMLMELEPGEVFTLRNVANLVPPWEKEVLFLQEYFLLLVRENGQIWCLETISSLKRHSSAASFSSSRQ